MGRKGVTYEQVAAAADALVLESREPTPAAVRERLGDTGSKTTIGTYLQTWRAQRPAPAAPSVSLPAELVKELNVWAMQVATAARSNAEERIVQLQADYTDQLKEGKRLEGREEELVDQVAKLTTERDQAVAAAQARADEINRAHEDVERERKLAGEAQIQAAEARLKLEGYEQQIAYLKAENQRLASELKDANDGKVAAERSAAGLQAERDAVRSDAAELRERLRKLDMDVHDARADARTAQDLFDQQLQEALASVKAAMESERALSARASTAETANATLKEQLKAVSEKYEAALAKAGGAPKG